MGDRERRQEKEKQNCAGDKGNEIRGKGGDITL